jgi:hypothetical protein
MTLLPLINIVGARGSAEVVGVLDGRTRRRSPAAAALGVAWAAAQGKTGERELSPRLLRLKRSYRDPVEPERL